MIAKRLPTNKSSLSNNAASSSNNPSAESKREQANFKNVFNPETTIGNNKYLTLKEIKKLKSLIDKAKNESKTSPLPKRVKDFETFYDNLTKDNRKHELSISERQDFLFLFFWAAMSLKESSAIKKFFSGNDNEEKVVPKKYVRKMNSYLVDDNVKRIQKLISDLQDLDTKESAIERFKSNKNDYIINPDAVYIQTRGKKNNTDFSIEKPNFSIEKINTVDNHTTNIEIFNFIHESCSSYINNKYKGFGFIKSVIRSIEKAKDLEKVTEELFSTYVTRTNTEKLKKQLGIVRSFELNNLPSHTIKSGSNLSKNEYSFRGLEFIATERPNNIEKIIEYYQEARKANVLITLTEPTEDGPLWYMVNNNRKRISYENKKQDIKIEVIFRSEEVIESGFVEQVKVRKIEIIETNTSTNKKSEPHTLHHVCVKGWADGETLPPEVMHQLTSKTIELNNATETKKPIMAHCKGGKGRLGTTVIALCIYDQYRKAKKANEDKTSEIDPTRLTYDIGGILRTIRQHRDALENGSLSRICG